MRSYLILFLVPSLLITLYSMFAIFYDYFMKVFLLIRNSLAPLVRNYFRLSLVVTECIIYVCLIEWYFFQLSTNIIENLFINTNFSRRVRLWSVFTLACYEIILYIFFYSESNDIFFAIIIMIMLRLLIKKQSCHNFAFTRCDMMLYFWC